MQRFFLYILRSESNGKYYVGTTKTIENRLDQHNRGAGKSTKSGRPWRLIYKEEYDTRLEAAKREKQVKDQKSRAYIENLVISIFWGRSSVWENV
jgi:putative endonuclease